MSNPSSKTLDPRVRRTRQLLHEALEQLLETKDFEAVSIQEIADAATLNRATFYDHYPDKAALLKCVVALRFQALLDARQVRFDGRCESALAAIALGVCDYLAGLLHTKRNRPNAVDPHLESTVISVIKGLVLEGLKRQGPQASDARGLVAAMVSWGIYGAAKEWADAPTRVPSKAAAAAIAALLNPILSTSIGGKIEPTAANDVSRSTSLAATSRRGARREPLR